MRRAVGLLIVLPCAVACSQVTAGAPEPQAPSTAPTGSTGPQISNPLDVTRFVNDPCAMVSADTAKKISDAVKQRTDSSVTGGQACIRDDADGSGARFSILTAPGGLMANVYPQRKYLAYFTETSVDGYPGVFSDVDDSRSKGDCSLAVGVGPDAMLSVVVNFGESARSDRHTNPCPVAQEYAAAALKTLKGGA